MRTRDFLCLLLVSTFGLGCGSDLGPCDEDAARQLVADTDGRLMYAGQGLLNSSCANGGCHDSTAVGEARQGAPATLDFDLRLAPMGPAGPDPAALQLLAVNQRRVFDTRDAIWEEIDSGRMPPSGVGEGYRCPPPLDTVTGLVGAMCDRGGRLAAITDSSSKAIVRNWLSCGSPVVETSDSQVPAPVDGTVGQQYPVCEGGGAVAPEDATFDRVWADVLSPSCALVCHVPGGTWPVFDLSTPEIAYATLTEQAATPACASAPTRYAKANDPDGSYVLYRMGDTSLVNVSGGSVSVDGPNGSEFCGSLMPQGRLEAVQNDVALMRAWIAGGALPPSSGGGVCGAPVPLSTTPAADAGP